MKISCPSCAAKYSIADEKVNDRLAKIRCRKCGTTIVIDGKVNPPHVHAGEAGAGGAEESSPAAAGEYSVDFGDNDQRSLSLADVAAAYRAGQITAETFVWTDGMGDWKPISEVPEILAAVGSSPSAAAKPDPFAVPAGAGLFGSAPEAAKPAARSGGRGSTADLFGGIDKAGSESDVATSAASEPAAAATGARNESSVLFSLSALTKAADPPKASGATTASREDSGLIDLKALTATKPEEASASPLGAGAPLGIAPLGMAAPLGLAPPLGGGASDAQANAPQKSSKMGLYVGGGIAVAAIAIAGALVATSGKAPPAAPVATAAAPPATPTAAAPATAAPVDTVGATPPATGTGATEPPPDEKKAAAGAKPAAGAAATKRPAAGETKPAAPAAAPPPAATSKPKSACGCKPGDLQCAMRCAARGG
ncbi:MAG: zinc-ribbon domain-containing protein [Polyangiaceae bacterium]|nr:zinc-ribbon domain-containing protein [Polyangiaceae bacterium]